MHHVSFFLVFVVLSHSVLYMRIYMRIKTTWICLQYVKYCVKGKTLGHSRLRQTFAGQNWLFIMYWIIKLYSNIDKIISMPFSGNRFQQTIIQFQNGGLVVWVIWVMKCQPTLQICNIMCQYVYVDVNKNYLRAITICSIAN